MLRNLALVGAIAMLAGCGPTNPPTSKVTGVVTLDGSPFEGAIVTFMPDDAANKPAVATSAADGTYALTTFEAGDGAMPGSYKVKVFKYETQDGGMSPYGDAPDAPVAEEDRTKEMTQEEMDKMMEEHYGQDLEESMAEKQQAAKNFLPEKYADHNTSGLAHTVGDAETTFDIALTK